jgi:RNA polymerase sigma-70 factor (ECF subfamily)
MTATELPVLQPQDEALMQALACHQPNSLELLYSRYAPLLKSVVHNVVQDESDSEDLLQEIFLQIWDRAASYSPEKGRPLGWMVTLARRRAIDRLRQKRAYRRATDRFETECNAPNPVDTRNPSEMSPPAEDTKAILCKLLDSLPAFQRQAIHMAYFEGLSQREIAAATRIPLGTIKTRIELGMRKLSASALALREKIL